MSFREEQLNEEIEEIRELLYDILKGFPAGVTSTFLEEQYKDRYVQKGLASPLPANWLSLVRIAEEFEVNDVSTFTMLYLVNANSLSSQLDISSLPEKVQLASPMTTTNGCATNLPTIENEEPLTKKSLTEREEKCSTPLDPAIAPTVLDFSANKFDAVPLNSLPQVNTAVQVSLVFATDPDKLYFRLSTWLPYCEYLDAALSRLTQQQDAISLSLKPGQILAATIDGKMERVELVRTAQSNPEYWVVKVVDGGYFHLVRSRELRPLTEAVTAFNKIFLAKCKLDGIQARVEFKSPIGPTLWPPETQHFIGEALNHAALKHKKVELVPTGEWNYEEDTKIPVCSARLRIDGVDFAEQLVSMGLAQRKSSD